MRSPVVLLTAFLPLAFAAWHGRADAAERFRAMYRCEVDGVPLFSDTPCHAGAQQYVPDSSRISTYDAPDPIRAQTASGPHQKPARGRTRREPDASAQRARQEAECARLNESLREIRSRMRAGYRAAEGEQLRQREAKLETRQRMQKCR